MTATTFDVRSFNRRSSDVATALLSALDVRELEKREAAVAQRESDVIRREKAIDALERIHELRGVSGSPVAVAAASPEDDARRAEQQRHRSHFKDGLRLREREWWTKVLGLVPQQS